MQIISFSSINAQNLSASSLLTTILKQKSNDKFKINILNSFVVVLVVIVGLFKMKLLIRLTKIKIIYQKSFFNFLNQNYLKFKIAFVFCFLKDSVSIHET